MNYYLKELAELTGHSYYKAMKPADDIKANAMSKFNQL